MPEKCKFSSLESCQRKFLWTNRDVLARHPLVGLVLLEGDVEKFPQTLGLERLDPFLSRWLDFFKGEPMRGHIAVLSMGVE